MEKTCKVCGITKPIDCFNKGKSYKDGYNTRCRTCNYLAWKEGGHMKKQCELNKQPLSLSQINNQLSRNRKRHKEAERFMPIRKPVVFGGMGTV